jgi:hypothetical protein
VSDIVERLRERTDYSTMLLCDPPRPAPDRLCHDAANARIAELERELEARKNYTDEDYIRLHNAHCFTAIKLATANARAERLEAALRECFAVIEAFGKASDGHVSPAVWGHYDAAGALERTRAALQPPEAP